MIDKQIELIEAKVQGAPNLPEPTKAELLDLLKSLRQEVKSLSETHAEAAVSITGFANVSAHEGIRGEKRPDLLDTALKGLSESVSELETSHPKLVDIVNRLTVALSNMGI